MTVRDRLRIGFAILALVWATMMGAAIAVAVAVGWWSGAIILLTAVVFVAREYGRVMRSDDALDDLMGWEDPPADEVL